MWKLPMLKQCCCGCSLKRGSIIIGVLGIVHGIATIVEAVHLFCGTCPTTFKMSLGLDDEMTVVTGSVLGSLLIALGIVLIVASIMEVPRVVLAWVVGRGLVGLLTVFLVPISIGLKVAEGGVSRLFAAHAFLVFGVPEIGLDIYFLLVVYSFYRIIAGNEPPPEDV
ncbi:uncharacterized protein LOC126343303 [Schistocerca gregaria]|uniref:uncharacterized protein LOC126343303 n=1 Tax=Schistocerca gregaria TaxID=7010 RepID=UPI00211F1C57|nr:uncharacterized protein LOC126343303 [Schistocerca gregaria]